MAENQSHNESSTNSTISASTKSDASAEMIATEASAQEEAIKMEAETKNEATKAVPATPPATPKANMEPQLSKDPSTTNVAAPDESSSKSDLPESISAPILEAATILKAVGCISLTPVTNPEFCPTAPSSAVESSPVSTTSVVEALAVVATPVTAPVIASTLADGQMPVNQAPSPSPAAENEKSVAGLSQIRDEEVETLKTRVQTLESELAVALGKPGKGAALVETIKQQHEELLNKARGMLFDKTKILKNQELQIAALTAQVESLKDVNSITKDLLNIRNTEVKQLEERLECMEERFKAEKERHVLMLKRAESGHTINNELKTEYEGQLQRFKELREMYDRRVQVLAAENKRLSDLAAANGLA